MKQPTRTLPQAVKLFPKSWSEILNNTIPDDFYNLTWEQKYKNLKSYNQAYYCSNKNGKIFFGFRTKTLCRSGRKFYPKIDWSNTIVIDGRRISTHKLTISGLCKFASVIGIDLKFVHTLPTNLKRYLVKECVIADILRKKVYNEETLCKCVLSKIYHLKGFDWKLFFNYNNNCNYLSIPDLQAFTKDLAKSISVLVREGEYYNPTYRDLLDCAIQLNETVDFTWSKKRIQEEHRRQINELNRREIEAKEQVPVFDVCLDEPHIHMLNTEKEVFLEGINMHHCLYNCYWDRIKSKNYIAFHMSVPEDCTFSFKVLNNKVVLDQAFLAYDKQISDITRTAIVDFQNRNEADLYKMLTEEYMACWPPENLDLPYWTLEINYD